jgi:hypothetical protein
VTEGDRDETDELLDDLVERVGLALGGLGELGLGAGPHPTLFYVLRRLDAASVDRLLHDHHGDDFLEVVPGAFDRDDAGMRRWRREALEPVALVGVPGTFELGSSLDDALPCAAVLFLDRGASPPSVLGWNRSPVDRLAPLAPALADLDLRAR